MPSLDAIRLIHHQPANNHNSIPKKNKRPRKWKWLALFLILLAIAGWAGFKTISKTSKIFTSKGNIFTRVSNLLVSPDKPLIGETEGIVNVLLMGIGGTGHNGANLTDTMIVASINTNTNEVVLVSIPRDFAVNLPKVGYNKINAAYAYAFRDDPNSAGTAAIDAVQQITGMQIPYYATIDFKGFVKAVDDVGGVDVTVDNTFTDSTFPNDYPYDTSGYLAPVTFTAGPQHMNGQRALIFARSRHSGNSSEGSDFSRSERQKKILTALKGKITSLKLNDLATLNNLLNDFTENFRTNMEPFELKRLVAITQKISNDNVYSFSLEPQNNLICSAMVDQRTGKRPPVVVPPLTPTPTTPPVMTTPTDAPDATGTTIPPEPTVQLIYVVQPCEGKTLADIHQFLIDMPFRAKLLKEAAVIEIQNSTGKSSVETRYKKLLDFNLDVRFVPFKGKVPYDQTIFYDNSRGSKPRTLEYLKSNYNLTTSDVNYPSSNADFVIVLGKDAQ